MDSQLLYELVVVKYKAFKWWQINFMHLTLKGNQVFDDFFCTLQ